MKTNNLLEQLSLLEVLYRHQERDSHCVLRDHRQLFCTCDISIQEAEDLSVSSSPMEKKTFCTSPVGETSPNKNSSLLLNDPVGDNMLIPARRIASRSNWVGLEESRLLIMLPSRLDKKKIVQKK